MIGTVVFLEPKGTILEVVRAAKGRGYRVVALISDESLLLQAPAPYKTAVPLIDLTVKVQSWQDIGAIEKVIEGLASQGPISGIYSGMDPCVVTSAILRKKYGLPTPDPETFDLVLDKHRLRTRLRELGLSQLKTIPGALADTWQTWQFPNAAYFKPVRGFFSAYVKRCTSLDDLREAQEEWRKGSPSDPSYVMNYLRSQNEYHLEEAFDGELLSVEAFSRGGVFFPLGLLSRILYSKNPIVEMGSCFPYPHPLEARIIDLVKRAHEELGLLEGPTHTEVIVSRDGEVEIIDLNPRFVGADVMQSINFAYGIRMEEALLDFALGVESKVSPKQQAFSCLQYFLPPVIDTLETVEFPTNPEVKFRATFIEPGTKIVSTGRQLDYLGCYLTVMPSFLAASERSHELRGKVRVNGRAEGVY